MPRFDGTGPWGLGPNTGWGRGICLKRRLWCSPLTKKEEKEVLKEEAEALEEELKAVKDQLNQLK